MGERFNMPRLSLEGEERIRRAMERGNPGDDPGLPIRRFYSVRDGDTFLCWRGPVDYDGPEEKLWEMEIDLKEFKRAKDGRR